MKLRFRKLLVLACCLAGIVSAANANANGPSVDEKTTAASRVVDASGLEARGPEVPFPLSADFPFPWGAIEGIWEAKGKSFDALFSFEVQAKCNGQNVLRVYQIDPKTGEILAEGTGIGDDERKIVRAIMSNSESGEAYMLFIGSFLNRKAIRPKTVTVLTVRSLEEANGHDVQMIVRKVSNLPFKVRPSSAPDAYESPCMSSYE